MTSCAAAAAAKRRIMRQQREAERARETKTIKKRERGGRSECVRVRCKVIIYSTSLSFTRRPTDPNGRTARTESLTCCLSTYHLPIRRSDRGCVVRHGGRDGRRGDDLWQFFESSCLCRLERAASSRGHAHVSQLRRLSVRPSAFSLSLRRPGSVMNQFVIEIISRLPTPPPRRQTACAHRKCGAIHSVFHIRKL